MYLTTTYGVKVWVLPQNIESIEPYGSTECMVYMTSGRKYIVKMSQDEAIKALGAALGVVVKTTTNKGEMVQDADSDTAQNQR